MPDPKPLSRRGFLGQASCAAIGSTALFNTLLNLRMAGTAAAQSIGGGNDYKALVCLFLAGGNDSFNMLVPRGVTEWTEYEGIRRDLALPRDSLLAINPLNDPGRLLGVHPNMPQVQGLFDNGRLAFVSNVGTLVERINKQQYESGAVPVPLGLYSHADQIQQWQTSIPDRATAIGWGGRMGDLLASLNENQDISINISIAGSNVWQAGNQTVEYAISPYGSTGLDGISSPWNNDPVRGAAIDSMLDLEYKNLFEQTFVRKTRGAIDAHYQFSAAIAAGTPVTTVFPANSWLGDQLRMVARTIAARTQLGVRRQTFFVMAGGWDHHDEVINNQQVMLADVSAALGAFQAAMAELGVENDVTLFSASDFGRTLTSNGAGSDHAWGGNQLVMGGAVRGQRIFGHYPNLYENNPLDTGRGRLIPTTSVDEFFADLALWFGVDKTNLPLVLPNIERFYNLNASQTPLGLFTA
ncbi:MAG TPA: DUF1501 domain-containing protein [Kiritimatiellia bacterium]|nr:DUF1501 domain-containing protein [Kiritimatiellia bacterium]